VIFIIVVIIIIIIIIIFIFVLILITILSSHRKIITITANLKIEGAMPLFPVVSNLRVAARIQGN
jgi:hypothetical protein